MADKTVTYRLLADITQFRAQMAQAAASTKAAADRMTSATKEGAKFRSGLNELGSTAGKIGLVAAAGLAIAVKTSADFDQSMSRVQAATHESASNMELLRGAAIKAGRDTVFSATEAADGITALAKAGVSTKDILGGALTDSLNLASAGEISVGQAAEIAATTMNQFGLQGKDVGHIADDLAAAAGKAQGEVTDMAEALKYVGPVAAQMGVSLDQTVGSIAELASQGVLGSEAGTSLRGMLTALTSPSTQAAKQMDALGISVYDAQGKFVGFDGIAGQLHDTMSKLSAADRDEALGRIFGNQQITAARILYAGGAAAVDKWTASVNDSGYAAETAKIKLDNLKGDLKQLGGSLETALITTGSSSQGPLRTLVRSLTDVVNAYNKLPPAAQGATSGLVGLTAVIGGGAWFSAKVISGVADTRKAIADLGDAAPKAAAGLKALGAATAIVGGILILKNAVDGLEHAMQGSLPTTQELAGRLLDLNNGNIADLGKQFDNLGNSLDLMSNPASGLAAWSDFGAGLLPFYTSTNEQVSQLKDQLSGLDSALASIATNGSADQAKQAFTNLAKSQGLTADQQKYLLSQLPQYRDALAGAANAAQLAGDAAGSATGGVTHLGGAFKDAGGAAMTFKGALAEISAFLDKREAWRNYQQSIEDWKKSMKSTGPASRQSVTAMDAMTRNLLQVAAGMKAANRVPFLVSQIHMLEDMAKKSPAAAKALAPIIDHLYGAAAAAAHASGEQAKLITQYHLTPKQAATVIKQIGMGASQSDIRDLLKQYGLTPKQVTTAVRALGALQAASEVNSLRNQLALLHDKAITVTVTTNHRGGVTSSYGGHTAPSADGNLFEFASGGYLPKIGDQRPQLRAYTGPRGLTWSEEGSGPWEAFISGNPAKADRSRAIAADVVARLGGQVQFAHGGMIGAAMASAPAQSRAGVSVEFSGPITTVDVRELARVTEQRQRDALAMAQGY